MIKRQSYKQPLPLNRNWTNSDMEELLSLSREKKPLDIIAKKLNRSTSNVQSKLKLLAANMYLKDNLPIEQIQKITGIQKNSFIITKYSIAKEIIEVPVNEEETNVQIFPGEELMIEMPKQKDMNDDYQTKVDVRIVENADTTTIIVSMDSPFTRDSICDNISRPLMSTFVSCSVLVKKLAGLP